MNLTVNGETRRVDDGLSVDDLVAAVAGRRAGVAVAVDGAVVPRSAWAATPLRAGSRVEILDAHQGG